MPPTPAGCSITRLLSVSANCPSRKKPSRGMVAIQLGLPRPALRNADCVVREVFLASLINSSLISNGPRVSNLRSFTRSMFFTFQQTSRQQHDGDHAPDREQSVTHGVSYGVAERRHLALSHITDQAERSCRGARSGNDPQQNCVVEAEDILADEHTEDEGHRRRQGSPQEQANALRPQAIDESRPRRNADY